MRNFASRRLSSCHRPTSLCDHSPTGLGRRFQINGSHLKDEDRCPLRLSILDNAGTHQMGNLLVHVADLAPEVGIVLFVLRDDASL
jgi:hypothetical protein